MGSSCFVARESSTGGAARRHNDAQPVSIHAFIGFDGFRGPPLDFDPVMTRQKLFP
jgi:hypothetical protein